MNRQGGNGRILANDSGSTRSIWMAEKVEDFATEIPHDARPDVCVIGAGIAGLSVALALVQDGFDVLVLDQGPIGGGQTARSSAHLSSALDDYFHVLERRFGRGGSRLCGESHAAAIAEIERNIHTFAIDCDFRRVDGYLFGGSSRFNAKERDAARRAGLRCDDVGRATLPFDSGPALRFADQGELHPLAYVRGIADAVVAGGGRICTGVHVAGVESGSPVKLTLQDGRTLRAGAVVDCTQMTITSMIDIPTREAAYRTYCIAFAIERGYVPHGLYWDTEDPYHFIRVAKSDDEHEILIVGGEDHRVGQGDPEVHFPRLEAWVRARFDKAGAAVAHWSGQIQEPHDGNAYIGPLPRHDNVYVVTGDSGHGITHGVIAGLMMPSLIHQRAHPWERIYSPGRTRWHALMPMASEALKSSAPYTDWMRGGDVSSPDEIVPGHGATIRRGAHVLAVYKDEHGQCHASNARCTHLSGVVRWNEVEKTWDCPCHGSRFDAYGRVLNGPAISDLEEGPDLEAPAQIPEPILGDEAFSVKPA